MFDYCADCASDSVAINGLCETNPVIFVMIIAIAITAARRVTPRKNSARGTNIIKKTTMAGTLVEVKTARIGNLRQHCSLMCRRPSGQFSWSRRTRSWTYRQLDSSIWSRPKRNDIEGEIARVSENICRIAVDAEDIALLEGGVGSLSLGRNDSKISGTSQHISGLSLARLMGVRRPIRSDRFPGNDQLAQKRPFRRKFYRRLLGIVFPCENPLEAETRHCRAIPQRSAKTWWFGRFRGTWNIGSQRMRPPGQRDFFGEREYEFGGTATNIFYHVRTF
jgi:hypothetical protein